MTADTDWINSAERQKPVPASKLRALLSDLHTEPEDFTPEFTTVDPGQSQPFTLPANATLADEAGLWGAPAYGWFSLDGDMVDFSLRIITGTMIDDEFDPGQGYAAVNLPLEAASFAAQAGSGWVVGMTEGFATRKQSVHAILDPAYTTDAVLLGVDGLTTASGFDIEAAPAPWVAIAPDYPVPFGGPLLIVVLSGRYRRAA